MAWIDSLLGIVNERGADELRVGAGHEPQMLASGVPKRLSIPKMSRRDVEDLLGELLSPERKARIAAGEKVELRYDSKQHGAFQVVLSGEDELSARFTKGVSAKPPAAPDVAPSPPAPQSPPVAASVSVTPARESFAPTSTQIPQGIPSAAVAIPFVVEAARVRASDLHLADGEAPVVRVDGELRALSREKTPDVTEVLGLSSEQRSALATRGSLDFSMRVDGVGLVRVHTFRGASGVAAAVRLLPELSPSLASLGMPLPLDDLIMLPHGLVVVCGPAGAGKSTTLAALAQEALTARSIVLVTLEDPIELGLVAPGKSIVRRRQVGRDVATFAAGLRDALREDPDVLVVGEMRDPETITLALTAAETGHLVLGSMHSRSAASAVQRVFDVYPPERQAHIRAQLAEALRAVIAQRLVPRAVGSGRLPVLELLRVTTAVANTIREGRTAQIPSLVQAGRKEGMLPLERCLADRVRAGEITLEDARSAAFDPASLATYLND
ncbi:MAG TPA: PilT/PilU family type 4a pilus ATPase [Polyangiaceae bacterium]|nr:PilT/PilU family type 4a pilus ATPase [Polyangiaceae bacterium]